MNGRNMGQSHHLLDISSKRVLLTARSAQPPLHSRETRIDRVLALYNECIQVGAFLFSGKTSIALLLLIYSK